MIKFQVRLPKELVDDISLIAEFKNMTASELVRTLLLNYQAKDSVQQALTSLKAAQRNFGL